MTFAIVLLAITLMVGMEQLSIFMMTLVGTSNKDKTASNISLVPTQENVVDMNATFDGHSHDHDHENKLESVHEHNCEHGHTHTHSAHLIADENANRAIVKAVIMEFSIAVHSIIIGFDLGLLQSSDLITIKALMIAFAFHQFFEGLSLGVSFLVGGFSLKMNIIFTLFFSSTLPIGIIIGMTTSSMSTTESNIKVIASSFAAGALLYNGLVEMAGEEFSDPSLSKRPVLKLLMFMAMFIGGFCMALLAYWA